jgi:hypothetical protein
MIGTHKEIMREMRVLVPKGDPTWAMFAGRVTRDELVDMAVVNRLVVDIEDRILLKRALRQHRKRCTNEASLCELVQLGIKAGLDFDELI